MARLELVDTINIILGGKESYRVPSDEYFKGIITNVGEQVTPKVELNGLDSAHILHKENIGLGGVLL